ncbi:MAG TPA: EI24 domain-containing protein [Polyangiaceae bacterium]|nr:EI24 domain-containing protein [Polyangiaceae bacterium]
MTSARSIAIAKPTAPVAPDPVRPGFFGGLRCFFSGFGLVFGNPRAWPFAIVPGLSAVVLMIVFMSLSIAFVPDLVERWIAESGRWVSVVSALASIVAAIFSIFLALALAQPASAPALEALVRATERRLGLPEHENTPFFTDVARSLLSAGFALAAGAFIFTILLLLSLIPGAAVVTVPLKFVAAAILIGWDVCDYPLSVRGVSFRHRVRFIVRHADGVLGFSAGLALVAMVPCGFLLLLPVGVAGATQFVARAAAWDETPPVKRLGAGGGGKLARL